MFSGKLRLTGVDVKVGESVNTGALFRGSLPSSPPPRSLRLASASVTVMVTTMLAAALLESVALTVTENVSPLS